MSLAAQLRPSSIIPSRGRKPTSDKCSSAPPPSTQFSTDLPCVADIDIERPPQPTYTPDDINLVQAMLLRLIPAELADAIIEMAEFWPWVGVSRNAYTAAFSALDAPDHNAQWCYLLSPPVPSVMRDGIALPTTIKMVKFLVKSYASQWGDGSNNSSDMYSNTWFEASILKAEESRTHPYEDSMKPNDWYAHLAPNPKYLNTFDDPDIPVSPSVNPMDSKDRWHVISNPDQKQWSDVTWRYDDDSLSGTTVGVKDGQSIGLRFMDELEVGDRVVLMARALFPGWISNIYNVKIEIYYSLSSSDV
ncbi:hypothetical protein B0H34DRAFT_803135 [Crassisporium funariophilum]|nr:hypothetical protein B0H34DRAFT_803135 [Crassisporium funariophilum]